MESEISSSPKKLDKNDHLEELEFLSAYRKIVSIKRVFDPWMKGMKKLEEEEKNVKATIQYIHSTQSYNEIMRQFQEDDQNQSFEKKLNEQVKEMDKTSNLYNHPINGKTEKNSSNFQFFPDNDPIPKCQMICRSLQFPDSIILEWNHRHQKDSQSIIKRVRQTYFSALLALFDSDLIQIIVDEEKKILLVPKQIYRYLFGFVLLDAGSLDPTDPVKSMLEWIDFCGKFFIQDFAELAKIKELSSTLSWQYLYGILLDHIMEDFYSLLKFYTVQIRLSSLLDNLSLPEDQEYLKVMPLTDLDHIVNEFAKILNQLRSLSYVIHFYHMNPGGNGISQYEAWIKLRRTYLDLELKYFEKALIKAILIQEVPLDEPVYTSIDDAMFILRKVSNRLLFCLSLYDWTNSISSLLNMFTLSIINPLLSEKPIMLTNGGFSEGNTRKGEMQLKARLNSMALILSLLQQYLEDLENDYVLHEESKLQLSFDPTSETFSVMRSKFMLNMESLYREPVHSLNDHIQNELFDWFDAYFYSVIKSSLDSYVFVGMDYHAIRLNGSSEPSSMNDADERSKEFLQKYLNFLKKTLSALKSGWIEMNKNRLLQFFVDRLVLYWEKKIYESKYSMDGAFLLNHEIRTIIDAWQEFTNVSIRDQATRLLQLSQILRVEQASEIDDLLVQLDRKESKGITSHPISSKEAFNILSLRIDLN